MFGCSLLILLIELSKYKHFCVNHSILSLTNQKGGSMLKISEFSFKWFTAVIWFEPEVRQLLRSALKPILSLFLVIQISTSV